MRHTALLLTLSLAGCGADPGARLVGTWDGQVEGLQQAVDKQITEADSNKVSKGIALGISKDKVAETLGNLRLEDEFRADGTCVSRANDNRVEGTWKVVSSTADSLVVERGRKGSNERKVVALRFEGPDKYRVEMTDSGVTLVFTRKK